MSCCFYILSLAVISKTVYKNVGWMRRIEEKHDDIITKPIKDCRYTINKGYCGAI
jgi:hypothetical protein